MASVMDRNHLAEVIPFLAPYVARTSTASRVQAPPCRHPQLEPGRRIQVKKWNAHDCALAEESEGVTTCILRAEYPDFKMCYTRKRGFGRPAPGPVRVAGAGVRNGPSRAAATSLAASKNLRAAALPTRAIRRWHFGQFTRPCETVRRTDRPGRRGRTPRPHLTMFGRFTRLGPPWVNSRPPRFVTPLIPIGHGLSGAGTPSCGRPNRMYNGRPEAFSVRQAGRLNA